MLGDRRRISVSSDWLKVPQGEEGLQALQEMAAVADELSVAPPEMGFFAERRFSRRRTAEVR